MTYLYRHPRPHTLLALCQFPSIQELTIQDCRFSSFGDLRRTLTSLPNLTALSILTGVRWPVPTAKVWPPLAHGASMSSRPVLVELTYALDRGWVQEEKKTVFPAPDMACFDIHVLVTAQAHLARQIEPSSV